MTYILGHVASRINLTHPGRRTLHPEPIDVALTLRGGAEALLLALWGRLDADTAGVNVEGDRKVPARRTELVPTN